MVKSVSSRRGSPKVASGGASSAKGSWWSRWMAIVASVYLGFVFWTQLTALPVVIWYFPLWNMAPTGYEVLLFVNVAPVLLLSPQVRRLVQYNTSLVHFLSLVGFCAYKLADPLPRLVITSVGVAFSCLAWAADWRYPVAAVSWAFGFVVSVVLKMSFQTNNPLWPIMNTNGGVVNMVGLILGVVACVVHWLTSGHGLHKGNTKQGGRFEFGVACGLGGLLFLLHSMCSDSSTALLWVAEGYPYRGLAPVPWGNMLGVAALLLGLMWSSKTAISSSWLTWLVASAAAYALHRQHNGQMEVVIGYVGGLVVSGYCIALVPLVAQRASSSAFPGAMLGLAWLVYNLLCLASVWTVAYAFVPGGSLLRERLDIVLGIGLATVGLAIAELKARLPLQKYSGSSGVHRILAAVLLVAAAIIGQLRLPVSLPQPYHPEQRLITTAIWAIHFGLDNNGWASEARIASVLADLEVDVVGLLESDNQRVIGGNRDITQPLAESLNMYADYGPSPAKHTWGCALLSKFPIVRSTHLLLPSPVGELACGIYATLETYDGRHVDVVIAHNGQEEDLEDRRQQADALADILRNATNPVIYAGYVVSKPHEEIYKRLMHGGQILDIDESDDDRWCEYIGYRGLYRVGYARVSHGGITDTEIQLGKFVVPHAADEGSSDAEYAVSMSTVQPEEPGLCFPAQFLGEGQRGHHYHVFDQPRYYYPLPPPA